MDNVHNMVLVDNNILQILLDYSNTFQELPMDNNMQYIFLSFCKIKRVKL